jgi:Fe-S-cluster containining protein
VSDWQQVDDLVEAEMRGQPVACRKGCAWCCHQLVVLTRWADGEAILAAARARLSPQEFETFAGRVRQQARDIEALGHEAAETRRWTCPLLKDGACIVYDVRPVACRSVFSPDAACCRAMMEADAFEELSPAQQALATAIGDRAFRLQIAINDRRPLDGPVELRELLARLLDETGSR